MFVPLSCLLHHHNVVSQSLRSVSERHSQQILLIDLRRFYLEIEGKQRFKVVECWEQDGYRVARPEFFSDSPLAPDAQASLTAICQSVDQLANIWLDKVR